MVSASPTATAADWITAIATATLALGALFAIWQFWVQGFRPRCKAKIDARRQAMLLQIKNRGRADGVIGRVVVIDENGLAIEPAPPIDGYPSGAFSATILPAYVAMRLIIGLPSGLAAFPEKVRVKVDWGSGEKLMRPKQVRVGYAGLPSVLPPNALAVETSRTSQPRPGDLGPNAVSQYGKPLTDWSSGVTWAVTFGLLALLLATAGFALATIAGVRVDSNFGVHIAQWAALAGALGLGISVVVGDKRGPGVLVRLLGAVALAVFSAVVDAEASKKIHPVEKPPGCIAFCNVKLTRIVKGAANPRQRVDCLTVAYELDQLVDDESVTIAERALNKDQRRACSNAVASLGRLAQR